MFEQIGRFTKSQSEDVRHLFATVLLLFPNKESPESLPYLALFDEANAVRASVVQNQADGDPAHCVRGSVESAPLQLSDPELCPTHSASLASSSTAAVWARISTLLSIIAQHFRSFAAPLCRRLHTSDPAPLNPPHLEMWRQHDSCQSSGKAAISNLYRYGQKVWTFTSQH
jgi:hypothetical protein